MVSVIKSIYQSFINLVYPPECPYCEKTLTCLTAEKFDPHFCESCKEQIQPEKSERCSICDAPVGPFVQTEQGCYQCNRTHYHFDGVKSLGVYTDEIRNICLYGKESSGRPVVSAAVSFFWELSGKEITQSKYDLIIPVPFHWMERITRNHFSPETMAKKLSIKLNGKYSSSVLKKVKRTKKQSSLPASRRRSNVRNAFKVVKPDFVDNKSILLVDDILTTGSTANEIARCLKKAGAKTVSVVVIARVLKGGRFFQDSF